MEEQDLINGNGVTAEEKAMLDRELEDYRRNPEAGSPWKEVDARIRKSSRPAKRRGGFAGSVDTV